MSGEIFGCYLTNGGPVEDNFFRSVAGLLGSANRELLIGQDLTHCRSSSGGIAGARNDLTRMFLDATSAPWMWMVDADMGFASDTPSRLLLAAEQEGVSVMGALAFSWRPEEGDGLNGYRFRPLPTIFGWDGTGFKLATTYPFEKRVQVGATGAACLLINRTVMETIRQEHGEEWFTPMRYPDGAFLSEDLSFCHRVGLVGHTIMVDTAIKTNHAKTIHVSEEHWITWQMADREARDA